MNAEKIIAEAMKELQNAEVYEGMAAESRCKARKLLESVYSPAPSGGKRSALSKAQVYHITTRRRLNVERSAKAK